jgi:SAM-dependent methyltransferase
MDILTANRDAWNRRVREVQNPWTLPVTAEQVAAARNGQWTIHLTSAEPAPRAWFGDVKGKDVLCLASGGGQQGPIMAAAGARVTVLDLSDEQLGRDREVAEREDLKLRTVQGDMTDLSAFPDGSFDLIIHPVSNCFIPDVKPLWREAYRVLRPHGALLAGMVNPLLYALADDESLVLKNPIPYSDLTSMSEAERLKHLADGGALEFGHSLQDLIGGQLDAGLVITGFYESPFPGRPVSDLMAMLFATRAVRLT